MARLWSFGGEFCVGSVGRGVVAGDGRVGDMVMEGGQYKMMRMDE